MLRDHVESALYAKQSCTEMRNAFTERCKVPWYRLLTGGLETCLLCHVMWLIGPVGILRLLWTLALHR